MDERRSRVEVGSSSLHVVETGPPDGPTWLFVHGWPQTSRAWGSLMQRAAEAGVHAVALDLPGVGGSTGDPTDGSTEALAEVLHGLVTQLELAPMTLVGHDLGGMLAYAYLRRFPGSVARAVIMDTVVPGVAPWQEVLANPYVWHFAFHSVPELPELLVQGHQRTYFDYFYAALSPPVSGVSAEARDAYAEAYGSPGRAGRGLQLVPDARSGRREQRAVHDRAGHTGPLPPRGARGR